MENFLPYLTEQKYLNHESLGMFNGHIEIPYLRCALPSSGGKWSNIFSTPLSRFLMFLVDLSDRVSLAEPRQISFFVCALNRSTTSVPTLYVSSVVVDSPKEPPKPPHPLHPQPPPKLS